MSFTRPTVEEIANRMINDLESKLQGNTSLLPIGLLRVILIVVAFAMYVLYGVLFRLSENLLPDKSDEEWTERHGFVWGAQRKAAAYAGGTVTFTGVNTTIIPAGTRVQSITSSGIEYETLLQVAISGTSINADVKAVEAGVDYNTDEVILTLVSPITDIDDTVSVFTAISGGLDQETIPAQQERILQRIQEPGLGGAEADYKRWALEVAGVTNAWVKPSYLGAGTCIVVIAPSSAPLAATVQTYIEDGRQPVTANALISTFVYPYTEQDMIYQIQITPNLPEFQSLITDNINELHANDVEPGGLLYLSHLQSAIDASGVNNRKITAITKDGTSISVDDIQFDTIELPVLDSIDFQDF